MSGGRMHAGAALLAAHALAGCSTDVELALARELQAAGGGPSLTVSSVGCGAPSASSGVACTVAFHEALALTPVKVRLAPSGAQFPAAFELAHGNSRLPGPARYWMRVTTAFDGVALHRGQAAPRMAATALAAQDAAIAQVGPVYHARVIAAENLHSYQAN
jgi:hypothetical protein